MCKQGTNLCVFYMGSTSETHTQYIWHSEVGVYTSNLVSFILKNKWYVPFNLLFNTTMCLFYKNYPQPLMVCNPITTLSSFGSFGNSNLLNYTSPTNFQAPSWESRYT